MAAIFPLGQRCSRERAWSAGFAMTWVVVAVMLFCDRDVAPIFGHLSALAGGGPDETRSPRRRASWRSPCRAWRPRTRPSPRLAADPVAAGQPPPAVVLRFDQTVTITTRAIEVFTAGGHKVSGPPSRPAAAAASVPR